MKKILVSLGALIACGLAAPAAQAGPGAICIEREKNKAGNYYDSEYFARYGKTRSVDGFAALRAAKADHRKNYKNSRPYCRHNGKDAIKHTHMILIQSKRDKDQDGAHMNYWAVGFGTSRAAALRNAVEELKDRDPHWRSSIGYKITEENDL